MSSRYELSHALELTEAGAEEMAESIVRNYVRATAGKVVDLMKYVDPDNPDTIPYLDIPFNTLITPEELEVILKKSAEWSLSDTFPTLADLQSKFSDNEIAELYGLMGNNAYQHGNVMEEVFLFLRIKLHNEFRLIDILGSEDVVNSFIVEGLKYVYQKEYKDEPDSYQEQLNALEKARIQLGIVDNNDVLRHMRRVVEDDKHLHFIYKLNNPDGFNAKVLAWLIEQEQTAFSNPHVLRLLLETSPEQRNMLPVPHETKYVNVGSGEMIVVGEPEKGITEKGIKLLQKNNLRLGVVHGLLTPQSRNLLHNSIVSTFGGNKSDSVEQLENRHDILGG